MWMLALQPLFLALGVVVALEVVYLVLRRGLFERPFVRLRFQILVLAVGLVAYAAFSGGEAGPPIVFDVAAFAAVVLAAELTYRLADRLWQRHPAAASGRLLVPRLVRDLGALVVVFTAVVVAGNAFLGIDYASFLLPSAVVSAVLGLALQDVLKNVFAGIALQTETPFDIGDWIVVDGEVMQVVEVALRTTHLRNNLDVHFREPNANLMAGRIVNLGSGQRPVGFAVEVGVAYGSPPGLVRRTLEQAARETPGVAAQPAPQALVKSFGESAVVYEVRFWSTQVYRVARLRGDVHGRIWYRLHRDGWKIPYPMRTVEIEPLRTVEADKKEWRAARAEALLTRSDLFAELPEEARRRLAAAAQLRYFDAGELLVREGDAGDSLMLLARGRVQVTKAGAEVGTTRLSLATLEEGDYFGEMSLLTGEPRSASVVAEGPCETYVLERKDLAPILESDPAVAESLSRVLAERTAATAARFEDRRSRAEPVRAEQESLLGRIRQLFKL